MFVGEEDDDFIIAEAVAMPMDNYSFIKDPIAHIDDSDGDEDDDDPAEELPHAEIVDISSDDDTVHNHAN